MCPAKDYEIYRIPLLYCNYENHDFQKRPLTRAFHLLGWPSIFCHSAILGCVLLLHQTSRVSSNWGWFSTYYLAGELLEMKKIVAKTTWGLSISSSWLVAKRKPNDDTVVRWECIRNNR